MVIIVQKCAFADQRVVILFCFVRKTAPAFRPGPPTPWAGRWLRVTPGHPLPACAVASAPGARTVQIATSDYSWKQLLFAYERINSRHCQHAGYRGRNQVIALIQRVSEASVAVDGEIISRIGRGLLAFVAVQPDDGDREITRMVERILTYRVFPDSEDRMNESLLEQGLELLAVPQFTLAADTRKGARPSFARAAPPGQGRESFQRFLEQCSKRLPNVASGEFGANMQVALINDGPVTFWLES